MTRYRGRGRARPCGRLSQTARRQSVQHPSGAPASAIGAEQLLQGTKISSSPPFSRARASLAIRLIVREWRPPCRRSSTIDSCLFKGWSQSLFQPTSQVCQGICSCLADDVPAVGWWGASGAALPRESRDESGVVIRTVAGTSSEVLAAFLVGCQCGKRLLVGDTLGDTAKDEGAAWRETLAEVARRLDLPLLWGSDQARCPRCGTPVSRFCSSSIELCGGSGCGRCDHRPLTESSAGEKRSCSGREAVRTLRRRAARIRPRRTRRTCLARAGSASSRRPT